MPVTKPRIKWQRFIETAYDNLVDHPGLPFADMTPKKVPESAGVYLITGIEGRRQVPYYVGWCTNLSQRLYKNHLMGSTDNARLKKYLIDCGVRRNPNTAKKFIQEFCVARWLEESDMRTRGAIEGYVTGVLFPKYGIAHEH